MGFFTLFEIIDLIIIVFALGFIFSGFFKAPPREDYMKDPVAYYMKRKSRWFNWDDFKFATIVVAPAIVLHELGHKFAAMGFGALAEFHAAYLFLGLGILLRLLNFGFIFFVPAYVAWSGAVAPYQASLIAFAGPAVNLALWLGAAAWLRYGKVKSRWIPAVKLTSKINMFLFIFNMIPLKLGALAFDGYHVFSNLIGYIF